MAVELGTGYVSLVPSAQGFGGKVADLLDGELGGVGKSAGSKAGDNAGKGFLGSFGGLLKGGVLAIGAAAGAALVKGISDAIGAEQGSDKLAAQLGLSEEQSEEFGRAAGRLYAGAYGESLGQVNEAIGAVQSTLGASLGAADGALEDATVKALDFATAFDTDVADAVSSAGVLISSGLARDADHAFDLMVASSQKVPAAMREDLFDATDEYARFFEGLGFSAEEAFGVLINAAEDGTFGLDKTGDALKEFGIRATDMSKATTDALNTVTGGAAADFQDAFLAGGDIARGAFDEVVAGLLAIEDPSEQAAAAIALFGTPLEDLSVTEIPSFLQSLQNVDGGLGDVTGSAERMGDTLNDNVGTKIESFKRTALLGLQEFAEKYAIPALEKVADFGGRLGEAFQAGGLAGVADFLAEEFRKLGPVVDQALDGLGQFIVEKGPDVLRGLRDAWLRLGEFIYTEAYPALLKGVARLLFALGEWIVTTAAPYLGRQLAVWAVQFGNWVVDTAWPYLVEQLGVFLGNIGGWLVDGVNWLRDRFVEWGAAAADWLVTEALPRIVRYSAEVLAFLIGWIGDAARKTLSEAPKLAAALADWIVTEALPAYRRKLAEVLGAVLNWVNSELIPGLRNRAGEIASAALEWAADMARRTPGALAGVGAEVAAWFAGLPGRIRSAVGDLSGVLYQAGRDIVTGLVDGIRSAFGRVRDELGRLTSLLPDWKGPEAVDKRILEQSGRWLIEGLNRGIQLEIPTVTATLQAVAPTAVAAVRAVPAAVPAQPQPLMTADGRWAVYLDGQELRRSFVRQERAGR